MLFGQCPNGGGDKLKGASLTRVFNNNDQHPRTVTCSVCLVNSGIFTLLPLGGTIVISPGTLFSG